jgi:tRNA A37 threonylcarbamoyladenosine modification protein TsaB
MILRLEIVKNKGKLLLKENDRVVDEVTFFVDNTLSQILLPHIEAFLEKNHIREYEIKNFEYEAKECGLTTERIGASIVKAYNFGKTHI